LLLQELKYADLILGYTVNVQRNELTEMKALFLIFLKIIEFFMSLNGERSLEMQRHKQYGTIFDFEHPRVVAMELNPRKVLIGVRKDEFDFYLPFFCSTPDSLKGFRLL